MFIEPTITWVPSGSLGTYGLTQKLCLKKKEALVEPKRITIASRIYGLRFCMIFFRAVTL